jgi:hypothetical protein
VTDEPEARPESATENLFRDEALDFVARQRGPGELMRVSSAWTEWAFWSLFVLVGIGLAATLLVRISDEPLLYVLVPALRTLIERVHA